MEVVFLQIARMSVTASWVILAALVFRLILCRKSKVYAGFLWIVVLARLLCPIAPTVGFSFLPQGLISERTAAVEQGAGLVQQTNTQPPMFLTVVTAVWLTGALLILILGILSGLKLMGRLRRANKCWEEENICLVEKLDTSFVLGIFRPAIYLPSGLKAEQRKYIQLHEEVHRKRGDHLIKLLSFAALCLHWFNPLVWLAVFQAGRDMELSCDERVLEQLEQSRKSDYAETLLHMAAGTDCSSLMPAFGAGDIKGRIKRIVNYQKRTSWEKGVMFVVMLGICIGLGCNPGSSGPKQRLSKDENGYRLGTFELVEDESGEERLKYTDEKTGAVTWFYQRKTGDGSYRWQKEVRESVFLPPQK